MNNLRLILMSILSLSVVACASVYKTPTPTSPKILSELQQGKRYFDAGYYKSAMHELLPLAANYHQAEAQYAVGYMYYYGYGVTQDTDVGYFWIQQSANQHYEPAIKALKMM